jgi:iron(III) transport system permease protein
MSGTIRSSSVPRKKSRTALRAAALIIGLLAAAPLAYIAIRAFDGGLGVWERLWLGQIPTLIANTFALLFTAVTTSVVLGVGLAWLVEGTDLPGKATWRWVLALPLAVPAYIVAITHILLLRRGGMVDQVAMDVLGFARGEFPLPPIYSLTGATIAISLVVYPYVYLPVSARLRGLNRSHLEAGRVNGQSALGVFIKIVLPLVAPAIAAGALLVALYVLSDFGTVSMMRYRTFTSAIFNQFGGQIDRTAAAALSVLLVALTLPVLWAESRVAGRDKRLNGGSQWRPMRPDVALAQSSRRATWRRWLAFAAVAGFTCVALGLPVLVLGGLSLQALLFPTEADRIWGIGNDGALRHGLNSLLIAAVSATLATVIAFVPAYLIAKDRSRFSKAVAWLIKVPYALPGVIIGLAFIMLFNQVIPVIYGTVIALTAGFVLRLLPQSLSTGEVAIGSVQPSVEQAARVMGCNGWRAFVRVTLPIAAPGVLASWTLVFITAMKELPTAMMLRPPGFDTLAVRVWAAASESVYTQAAVPAFVLIVLTMIPLALVYRRGFGIARALGD